MWHHVCVAWKNTKGDWQLYLDGQLKSSGTDLKKIIRYQLVEQLSLDKTKIKSEGALKSKIALGRVR